MSIDPVALVVLGWFGGNLSAGAGRYLADRAYARLEKTLGKASRKASGPIEANDRVKAKVLGEAAFTDDDVTLEYLAGVLASSGPDDDGGAAIVAQIGRLSALQLRLHYIIYREVRRLWPDIGLRPDLDINLYAGAGSRARLQIDGAEVVTATGSSDARAIGSSLQVLDREGLLSRYELRWLDDEVFQIEAAPSGAGAEFFLWGHGERDVYATRIFQHDFELEPLPAVPETPSATLMEPPPAAPGA